MPDEAKVCWTIFVQKDMDDDLRSILGAEFDRPEALSEFVERAVAREILIRTINEVHQLNRDVDPDQLEREIDDALREVREERRQELAVFDQAS
jgi:hypothetical protein